MNVIWGKDSCTWCDKAKDLLDQYNFKYEVKDVFEHMEEFNKLFPDAKTVPQIIFNDQHVGGYNGLVQTFEDCNIFIGGHSIT